AGADDVALWIGADDGAVDRARNAVALDAEGDRLVNALTLAGGLVDRVSGGAPAVEVRDPGTEDAHDERAAAVRRAVERRRLVVVQIAAADEHAVRMRVIVRRPVLRLGYGG